MVNYTHNENETAAVFAINTRRTKIEASDWLCILLHLLLISLVFINITKIHLRSNRFFFVVVLCWAANKNVATNLELYWSNALVRIGSIFHMCNLRYVFLRLSRVISARSKCDSPDRIEHESNISILLCTVFIHSFTHLLYSYRIISEHIRLFSTISVNAAHFAETIII